MDNRTLHPQLEKLMSDIQDRRFQIFAQQENLNRQLEELEDDLKFLFALEQVSNAELHK